MPYPFKQKSHSGAGLQAIIYDSGGDKILGRGINFSAQDTFEINPVEEYGKDGIDEFVPGKMRGSGSIGSLFIAVVNENLPHRGNFILAGPYVVQVVIAEGFPNAGTIIDQYEEVWFTVHGSSFGASGLAAKNASFVYGRRIPGDEIQGVDYPVED